MDWFRDEGMIVGKVKAGENEFMTQGENADDFIHMVNESVITVFDIPSDYVDIIRKTRTYAPPAHEQKLLEDQPNLTIVSFGV